MSCCDSADVVSGGGGGGGVSADLSDLTPTAINESLVPLNNQVIALGSAAKQWLGLYLLDLYTFTSGGGDSTWLRGSATTTPSGVAVDGALQKAPNSTSDLALYTPNVSGNSATKDILIESGNSDTGTTGNIKVRPGATAGTAGKFIAEGDFVPFADITYALGAPSLMFVKLFAIGAYDSADVISADFLNRRLRDSTAIQSLNWELREGRDAAGNDSYRWDARELVDPDGTTVNLNWANKTLDTYWQFSGTSVKLPTGTSDPTGVNDGDAYYNTSTDNFRVFNGGTWRGILLV